MQHVAHVHRPAVAYPRHVMSTADMVALAEREYGRSPDIERIKAMIGNTQIAERSFAVAPQQLERGTGLAARAALYLEHALPLACEVSRAALDHAALRADEIDAIILASCTGFVMPSLDAYLMNRIGLPRTIKRMPLAQLGCVAGASALLKASDHCRAFPHARVLVVCVELSSLCFHPEFDDLSSAVCASIFGDGAAACVVAPEPWWSASRGPELLGSYSHLIDQSEDVMGWDLEPEGLRVRFAPTIPRIVEDMAAEILLDAARTARLGVRDPIEQLVVHPGGRKVLDAYARALELEPDALRHARDVLREYGNMSSPTVLFVLERFLADTPPSGRAGLLLGLGPGFCAEGVVFRW